MTIQEWISANFPVGMSGGVAVSTDPWEVETDPTWLANTIGPSAPPTYVALSALPIASQGWQRIFDQWKTDGIVA